MYKIASRKAQSALHRGKYADWVVPSDERRSLADERADLVRVVQDLDVKIVAARNKKERRELGLQKTKVATRLKEIKVALKGVPPPRSVLDHFIDVARERLGKHEFHLIFSEAEERAKAEVDRDNTPIEGDHDSQID